MFDTVPLAAQAPDDAENLLKKGGELDMHAFRSGYAAYTAGDWPVDRWKTFRLRFGIYAQRQEAQHMVRAKLPGGRLSFAQARAAAAANRRWAGSDIRVTTRQDLQFYFLPLGSLPPFLADLAAGGITTREASGNTLRNVTACGLAGICPKEQVDAGQVAQRLCASWIRDPLVQHMPRKFKTTVSGCAADCGQSLVEDLGFVAVRRDGQPGFRVVAGGGLGQKPHVAVPVMDFVEEHDLPAVQEAFARLHQRHSDRKRKQASRIKFLVDRFGPEEFAAKFREEFDQVRALPRRAWRPLDWQEGEDGETPRRLPARVRQKDGLEAVTVRLPLGVIDSDRLEAVTGIAESLGAAEWRLTRDQNLMAIGLPQRAVAKFLKKIGGLDLDQVSETRGDHDVVSCPGTDTCALGITASSRLAAHLLDSGFLAGLPQVGIKVSGCHNSCARHHVADIGLHGLAKKIDGRQVPHYQLHLGGDPENGHLAIEGPIVPARRAPDAVRLVLRDYAVARKKAGSFRQWVLGLDDGYFERRLAHLTDVEDLDDLAVDWGHDVPFRTGGGGVGECASPIVVGEHLADLARVGIRDIGRFLAAGRPEAATVSARKGLLAAANRLLLVAGAAPKSATPHQVLPRLREIYSEDRELLENLDDLEATLAVKNSMGDTVTRLEAWIDLCESRVEAILRAAQVKEAAQ